MDKKRRNTKLVRKTLANRSPLASMLELQSSYEHCGIHSERFEFLPAYGMGSYVSHYFDGLYISICDVLFTQDHKVAIDMLPNILELSFLIEGEQIITIPNREEDLIYESQESYMTYLTAVSGTITYHQRKRFKKVKIQMDTTFIKKHRLEEEYVLLDLRTTSLQHMTKPQGVKTQEILAEVLLDTRKGLLKRLFLESKTLELISLQLEDSHTSSSAPNTATDQLIKKLYQIQSLIHEDLSVQYSIQDLAKRVGLNEFIVKKEFKHVFGKTIFEYAMQLRIDTAKKLLVNSQKPIYEISEVVGYKNATHFSAAFKKVEGMTPKQYRKQR